MFRYVILRTDSDNVCAGAGADDSKAHSLLYILNSPESVSVISTEKCHNDIGSLVIELGHQYIYIYIYILPDNA